MTKRTTGADGKRTSTTPSQPRERTAAARPLVYVYCIVESETAPPLGRLPGLPDAGPARAVSFGPSRWLVLADVPPSRFDEPALTKGLQDLDWVAACALAHDALIIDAMKSGPVVPMRLFTIFQNEARACLQARGAARQIARTLKRVAGHAEYGVRIGRMPAARRTRSTGRPAASGRGFLEQKRDQLAARRRSGISTAERQRVFGRLAVLAGDARERPIPDETSSVWLDGAFLVPLDKAAAFREEVERLTGELRTDGHDVVLTGPWPPYSFLDEHAVES